MDQPLLVKRSVLTQRTVNFASNTSVHNGKGDSSTQMSLVEKSHDLVSSLEPSHACADGFDCASSIGGRDYAIFDGERVFALRI